jgi:hypothetical protein
VSSHGPNQGLFSKLRATGPRNVKRKVSGLTANFCCSMLGRSHVMMLGAGRTAPRMATKLLPALRRHHHLTTCALLPLHTSVTTPRFYDYTSCSPRTVGKHAFGTMASATSFYDFKPKDSMSLPLSFPFLHPAHPAHSTRSSLPHPLTPLPPQ